mmetsp:Transcript_16852/g.42513  ORF Transcript_16852/g.42513 Transcript_16852/m.42513 type:complete len:811 (-) Transcript_16852:294-2726(-)
MSVSVEISPPRPGESGVHRHPKGAQALLALPFPNEPTVNTVWHVFLRTCAKFPQRQFLGHRAYLPQGGRGDYTWETYESAKAHVAKIAQGLTGVCGLTSQGQGPQQARVGIYSINRPEWTKCLLAAMSQRIVAVPLYDTLGPNATTYIIDHAELTVVLCERSKLESLLKGKGKSGRMRTAVVFEDIGEKEKSMGQQAGVKVMSLSEMCGGGGGASVASRGMPTDGMSPVGSSPTGMMPGMQQGMPQQMFPGNAMGMQPGMQQPMNMGGGMMMPQMAAMPMMMPPASSGAMMGGAPVRMSGGSFGGSSEAESVSGGNFGVMPRGMEFSSGMQGSPTAAGGSNPTPSDWSYIMYTSGTTGEPKGVVLSHQNVLAPVAGLLLGTDPNKHFVDENDTYLSFLPLAHIYECNTEMTMVAGGGRIGFFCGDPVAMLKEDLPMLKPTIFAAVPRIYSRMYDKVGQGMEAKGFLFKGLYKMALKKQGAKVAAGAPRSGFYDKLFKKVQTAFGGNIRIMASGAAPLSADMALWAKTVFGCPVCQGYGMTENSGAAVAMSTALNTSGTVGGPLPCIEVKLVDTDDYKVSDRYPDSSAQFDRQFSFKGKFDARNAGKGVQRGEVCMRGPGVCLGYYKMEKETREVIDSQGWLHTGDIGQWNPDGSLSIIDRKKNIFKLAQGEYVAPEAIEAACTPSKWVSQVFVYGNSLEYCTVAIVVPDKDTIMPYAKSKGINGSLQDVCKSEAIKSFIYADMKLLATEAGVKGYEMPKDICLEGEVNGLGQGFNIDNDCLTPTLKMRRPQLQKRYQAKIDAMYAGLKKK